MQGLRGGESLRCEQNLSQLPDTRVTRASQQPRWAYFRAGRGGRDVQEGVDSQSPRVPRCARLSRNGRSACNLITAGLLRSQSANPQQSPARSRANVGGLHLGGRRPVHTFPSAGAAARSPEGAGCARTRASGRRASPFLTENTKGGQRRQAGVHAAGGEPLQRATPGGCGGPRPGHQGGRFWWVTRARSNRNRGARKRVQSGPESQNPES